jgi:hypothetical protein
MFARSVPVVVGATVERDGFVFTELRPVRFETTTS